MANGPGDYEVGYAKPPKHTRFKPGQSGNPKGKEKGKRGLKTDLVNALDAKQTIKIKGKPHTGTRQSLTVLTLATRAAAGDLKAAQLLLPPVVQLLGAEDRGTGRGKLSKQDQAIVEQFLGKSEEENEPEPEAEASADGGGAGSDPPVGNAGTLDEEEENDNGES